MTTEASAVSLEAKSPYELRVHLGDGLPEQTVREALASGDMGFLHSFTTGSAVDGPGVRVVARPALRDRLGQLLAQRRVIRRSVALTREDREQRDTEPSHARILRRADERAHVVGLAVAGRARRRVGVARLPAC